MIINKLKFICAIGAVFLCVSASASQKEDFKAAEKAASGVIARTLGRKPSNVKLVVTGPMEGSEYFSTEVKKGELTVKGSSAVVSMTMSHRITMASPPGQSTISSFRKSLLTSRLNLSPLLSC